ncbi:hypothetical protein M885DRAFT_536249 [Pelagophyceae sp. CCMP2097]|nr:hypothetical protein M885DRAFT_536249 [Pelagophyceae sp. CCMP2097]
MGSGRGSTPRAKDDGKKAPPQSFGLAYCVVLVGGLALLAFHQSQRLGLSTAAPFFARVGAGAMANATAGAAAGGTASLGALEAAISERRRSLERINDETAALKAEQAALLEKSQDLAAAADAAAKEAPAEAPPRAVAEPAAFARALSPAAAPDAGVAASDLALEESASGRSGGRASRKRMRGGGGGGEVSKKRKLVSFYSKAGACSLAVAQVSAGGESEWLSCDAAPLLLETMFELTPSGQSAGAAWLRSLSNGRYVEMVPPGESLAWVVKASVLSPPESGSNRFEFELFDGAYLRNVGARACITAIQPDKEKASKLVRGHGNKPNNGRAADKEAWSSWEWTWLDEDKLAEATKLALQAAEAVKAEELADELRIAKLPSTLDASEKRVVAYGLYGSNPKYTTGAIRNAELVKTMFPGWVARFYCKGDVPKAVILELEKNGAEIVHMDASNKGKIGGMFWRFLVADDPTVDRYIVRDSDSRLNARERFAVEEWIDSGKQIHTIRDHPNHDRPLNGGLWGGVKGAVPGMIEMVKHFQNKESYGGDLQFLNNVIWPLVKHNQLGHDAYTCQKYPNSRPFPTKRPEDYQHVGQVFSEKDLARKGDIDGFMRGRPVPNQCRKRPDWKFG